MTTPPLGKNSYPSLWVISLVGVLWFLTMPHMAKAWIGGAPKAPHMRNGSLPLIENVGQFRQGALFQSEWGGGTLFLAEDALWLSFLEAPELDSDWERFDPITGATNDPPPRGGVHLRLAFVNANPTPTIEAFMPLTTSLNYFYGNTPDQWQSDVPIWGGVRYRDLYPGVDLELTGSNGHLTPYFIVQDSQKAELTQIQLQVEGADHLVMEGGNVVAVTERGTYPLPLFQVVTKAGIALSNGTPRIRGNRVATPFMANTPISDTQITPPAILPSNLRYATFLGGSDYDLGDQVVRDSQGAIYVGGYTESFDFPTTPGVFDPTANPSPYRRQAYVTKFNPSGMTLDYSTFIDGNNSDYVYGLAVDGTGAIYLAGETRSSDFPTTPNAPTPGFGGQVDGYVLKLAPTGSALVYGMYLGGDVQDYARDMALGTDGTVVVMGATYSGNFPVTPNAFDNSREGFDMFVTRISADGAMLIYSTYLGGSLNEYAFGVAVDALGATYVLGLTASNDYPTTPGAFDPTPVGGNLVVTKFTPNGNDLIYSTAISGVAGFTGGAIAVDASGAAYFTSEADMTGFPVTEGAYDTSCGTEEYPCNPQQRSDGILIKLNPAGSEVVYGTYFGGGLEDRGGDILLDAAGNAYVAGRAESPDLTFTPGGYSVGPTPNTMPFVLYKFDASGSNVLHLVRSPGLSSAGIFLDAEDILWVTGNVYADLYTFHPTENAYDTTYAGGSDGGVARLLLTKAATIGEIPTTGGTALSTSDVITVSYTFAANTFTETAVFTHAPRHPISMPPLATGITLGDPFVNYAATVSDTLMSPVQPYTVAIEYGAAPSHVENTLMLYYWDGAAWVLETTATLDPALNRIVATPNHVGWWVVAGIAATPKLYFPMILRE